MAALAGVLLPGFSAVNVTSCVGIQHGVRTGDVNAGGMGKDEVRTARFPAGTEK